MPKHDLKNPPAFDQDVKINSTKNAMNYLEQNIVNENDELRSWSNWATLGQSQWGSECNTELKKSDVSEILKSNENQLNFAQDYLNFLEEKEADEENKRNENQEPREEIKEENPFEDEEDLFNPEDVIDELENSSERSNSNSWTIPDMNDNLSENGSCDFLNISMKEKSNFNENSIDICQDFEVLSLASNKSLT